MEDPAGNHMHNKSPQIQSTPDISGRDHVYENLCNQKKVDLS